MAHKTLLDGTAYDVVGGSTFIDGTSYTMVQGNTLTEGTGYIIPFGHWELVTKTVTASSVPTRTTGTTMVGGFNRHIYPSDLGLSSWSQVEKLKVTYYQTGGVQVRGAYGGADYWSYSMRGPFEEWISVNNKYGRSIGGYTDDTYTTYESPYNSFTLSGTNAYGYTSYAYYSAKHTVASDVGALYFSSNSGSDSSVRAYQFEVTYWEFVKHGSSNNGNDNPAGNGRTATYTYSGSIKYSIEPSDIDVSSWDEVEKIQVTFENNQPSTYSFDTYTIWTKPLENVAYQDSDCTIEDTDAPCLVDYALGVDNVIRLWMAYKPVARVVAGNSDFPITQIKVYYK